VEFTELDPVDVAELAAELPADEFEEQAATAAASATTALAASNLRLVRVVRFATALMCPP
jgi:hypothetical protein